MKSKLSFTDVIAMYGIYIPGNVKPAATRRGAKHNHQPARKPMKSGVSPAQYRREHRGRKES